MLFEELRKRIVTFKEHDEVFEIEDQSSWHSAETLHELRENACDLAFDAHHDGRFWLWTAALDEEPACYGLLCMWTCECPVLRGLEKNVSLSFGKKRLLEKTMQNYAVLHLQHDAGVLELAEISRRFSHSSRQRAEQMGKADWFAVESENVKEKRAKYVRDKMDGRTRSASPLPELPRRSIVSSTAA
jgi:hypothetical protein